MEEISFKEVIRILDMNFKKFKIILIGISNGDDFRFNPPRETSLLDFLHNLLKMDPRVTHEDDELPSFPRRRESSSFKKVGYARSLLKNDVLIVVGYESSIKEFRLYLHRFGGKK
jgi:hypothetical protein